MRRSSFHRSAFALATAVAFVAPHLTRAEPVLVQNDSVTDFSQTVIVGGFVTGEEGGSWLTSPCDGKIIEVRILWWAGDPGAPPYLASNLWIRETGTFPEAGAVLQQLQAPLMEPFVMNVFQYVDENQTVPLEVPVSQGQTVAVTLEFDEPTFPPTGSILSDLDGCQAGKNVILFNGQFWVNACLLGVQGDWVFRMVVDCQEPTGACCLPNGLCAELDATACSESGGDYQGDGVSCLGLDCPDPPQACCFMPEGCLDLDVGDCQIAGGFPQGPGSNCDIVVCFPRGGCCLPDGSCLDDVSPEECDAVNGAFQGDGTTCAGTSCPQPLGACCLSNGACLDLEDAECGVIPGSSWAGPFTDCTDADGNGTADDCEPACGDPPQDVDRDCDVDVNDYQAFAACVTGPGGNASEGCLCYDQDSDGDVDLIDYGAFSAAFTGPGAGCN